MDILIFNAAKLGRTFIPYGKGDKGIPLNNIRPNELVVMRDPNSELPKPGEISPHGLMSRIVEEQHLDVGFWIVAISREQAEEHHGNMLLCFRSLEQKKVFLETLADKLKAGGNECIRPSGTEEAVFLTVHSKRNTSLRF